MLEFQDLFFFVKERPIFVIAIDCKLIFESWKDLLSKFFSKEVAFDQNALLGILVYIN